MVRGINTFDVSERLACQLVGLSRSAFRRPLRADTPDDPDRALRAWLRDYARRHPWWGYRRAYVDARNDGWQDNHKKIQRLWAEQGFRVVVKRRRKRIGVSTVRAMVAEKASDVWSVDFQFDSTTTGKPVRILSIVDGHTRGCLGGIVDYSITGLDLAEQLDLLAIDRSMPKALRMDNGPEFISNAVAQRASETVRVFIPPGQPWRNGFVESFNGKLRDECLSVNQLLLTQPCQRHHRHLGGGIQHHQGAFILEVLDLRRLCWSHQPLTTSDDSRSN